MLSRDSGTRQGETLHQLKAMALKVRRVMNDERESISLLVVNSVSCVERNATRVTIRKRGRRINVVRRSNLRRIAKSEVMGDLCLSDRGGAMPQPIICKSIQAMP
jgi:hypothetical protein